MLSLLISLRHLFFVHLLFLTLKCDIVQERKSVSYCLLDRESAITMERIFKKRSKELIQKSKQRK